MDGSVTKFIEASGSKSPDGRYIIAKKILIVEDDASFLKAISYILEKEGYHTLTATNGLEGLTKAQQEKPDLMTLDVMLPGLDGFEVCNRLRGDPETARMPIIMLSAKGQEIDKATGLKVGADRYLSKPVDRHTLLDAIEEMTTK
ncbi:MAG: response regulator [Chloroflexota bacterium]|nr:response regulator [Chloroflexota bacterium]